LALSRVLVRDPIDPANLRALGRSEPSIPYTFRELITLRSWALAQGTENRRLNAAALLSLGIGAGLTGREIVNLTVDDIQTDENGVLVHVRGDRERTVPVLREWESALQTKVAGASITEPAFRPGRTTANRNLITDFVSRANGKVALQARRMRATWLVHHLEAGTPLVLLLAAAGLSSPEALDRFLKFVRPIDPLSAQAQLRDASAPHR
jgi:integrase